MKFPLSELGVEIVAFNVCFSTGFLSEFVRCLGDISDAQ